MTNIPLTNIQPAQIIATQYVQLAAPAHTGLGWTDVAFFGIVAVTGIAFLGLFITEKWPWQK